MPSQRAIEVIADACQALNFSHQHGIIHRDVKPANIMISKAGAVKVMDFGIARALADANSVTQTAAVIGTAQYLSPEQARGEKVDARSDVYSLGCVLYEILTGEPPFTGDSPVAVAYQHVREDPVPPSQRHNDISPELDAVVLKALAKNPDNRYQSAAEMRADLVRVHSGEAPEAPKVLTDAERTSFLSAPTSQHRTEPIDPVGRPQPDYADKEDRGGSVGRWLIAVAVLAVLTVVVTVAINMFGGSTRAVQVPDVANKTKDDAVAILQNAGFKTRDVQESNSTVAPQRVIGTDPAAGTSVDAGDDILIKVSSGPEQREVVDCKGLSYAACVEKLSESGFGKFTEQKTESTPEQKDKVLATIPPANQTAAITNPITIVVGLGPTSRPVPDCKGQSVEVCQQVLTASGFLKTLPVDVDSTSPKGQVVGTAPAAGQLIPVDTLIQIQVSGGNQFVMPDVRGGFWTDVEANLRNAYGWTGNLIRAPDVQNSGQRTNAVVTQSPAPGTPVKFGDPITLAFAS
jgi:serine/threonine-protein kinase